MPQKNHSRVSNHPDLELRLFRYFVCAAEEKHFARAAERIGISPSTLTNAIQRLEEILSAKLFFRNSKAPLSLTEPGHHFYEHATAALKKAEEAAQSVRQATRGEIGRLEIGYMFSVSCAGLIDRFLKSFREEHPSIEIMLHTAVSLVQIERILNRDLDFGFVSPPKQCPSGLQCFEVYRQPMRIALHRDHRLADFSEINPSDLREETFVSSTIATELCLWPFMEPVSNAGAFVPQVSRRCDDMFTMLTYVSAGYGAALIPESLTRIQLPNVVYRQITGHRVMSPIGFIHRSDERRPAACQLIRHMRSFKLSQDAA